MLSFFKKKTPIEKKEIRSLPPHAHPFRSATELLEPYSQYLKTLKSDTDATKDYFDDYYLPVIHRTVEMLQLRPYGHSGDYSRVGGAIDLIIKRSAMTLKIRKSLMMPPHADAEEIAFKQALWTFGAFVTAIAKDLGGILLATELISYTSKNEDQGREWIGWYHDLDKTSHYKMREVKGIGRGLSQTSSVMLLSQIVPRKGLEWIYRDLSLLDHILDMISGRYTIEPNILTNLGRDVALALRDEDITLTPADVVDVVDAPVPGESIDLESGEITTQQDYDLPPMPEHMADDYYQPEPEAPHESLPAEKVTQNKPEHQNVKPKKDEAEQPPLKNQHDDENKPTQNKPKPNKPKQEKPKQNTQEKPKGDAPEKKVSDKPKPVEDVKEKKIEVSSFASTVRASIFAGALPKELAWEKGGEVYLLYPDGFKHYTTSPGDLLSQLGIRGYIVSNKKKENSHKKEICIKN